jgi:hypothetical protein
MDARLDSDLVLQSVTSFVILLGHRKCKIFLTFDVILFFTKYDLENE